MESVVLPAQRLEGDNGTKERRKAPTRGAFRRLMGFRQGSLRLVGKHPILLTGGVHRPRSARCLGIDLGKIQMYIYLYVKDTQ